jgi:hypothetical protein
MMLQVYVWCVAVWGISSHIEAGEPVVVGFRVNGPRGSLTGAEVFRHRAVPSDDWAQKLRAMTAHLETVLKQDRPDALVVRSLDWSPATRREAVARKRYQVDGAILSASRRQVEIVESRSGKELGTLCSSSKAAVEAEATSAFGADWKDAGAAAIGALVLAGQA